MTQASDLIGTYAPESLMIVINHPTIGSHIINGVADGSFINISREVPASGLYVGADLTAARVVRGNRASSIGVTLHQASESNDVLALLLEYDQEVRSNAGLFSITIKDASGRSEWHSPQAFIAQEPDRSFGVDIENREWVIQCVSLKGRIGGNAQITPSTIAAIEALGGTVTDNWRTN